MRINPQVSTNEIECALCSLCLHLQGRGIQAASRQKALLAEGVACPKVVCVLQGKGYREGAGGDSPAETKSAAGRTAGWRMKRAFLVKCGA